MILSLSIYEYGYQTRLFTKVRKAKILLERKSSPSYQIKILIRLKIYVVNVILKDWMLLTLTFTKALKILGPIQPCFLYQNNSIAGAEKVGYHLFIEKSFSAT